jgi:hypothetical protein
LHSGCGKYELLKVLSSPVNGEDIFSRDFSRAVSDNGSSKAAPAMEGLDSEESAKKEVRPLQQRHVTSLTARSVGKFEVLNIDSLVASKTQHSSRSAC